MMAQTCALSKVVSLRSAELGCTMPLDWCAGDQQNLGGNSTFTLAARQRHVSLRHWEGATAYRGLRTISTAG